MSRFREGSGRICLDFVRTLRHRGMPDSAEEITGPAALLDWVVQFGPWEHLPESTCQADDTVRFARQLREAIFRLVDAARVTYPLESADEADRAVINEAASVGAPTPYLDNATQLQWGAADPVASVLATVAQDALDLITSPLVTRVRPCAGQHCQALFVDLSRPGNRQWCSMNTCGNRAKKHRIATRQLNVPS
jgi:predicted RNA-binding Zn ribbon-like protein